ncbi:MAG: hypothetical protein EXX96DRAFT_539806 [Benjaminiella poitrasii]|nr:MAG: hypothetical protein EXX96DRAFT_539806 [Benjaminiella poitrasii]
MYSEDLQLNKPVLHDAFLNSADWTLQVFLCQKQEVASFMNIAQYVLFLDIFVFLSTMIIIEIIFAVCCWYSKIFIKLEATFGINIRIINQYIVAIIKIIDFGSFILFVIRHTGVLR